MNNIRKIGVLTGGGDCPGLNAVIRAVTKCAINEFGWEVVGFVDGFKGLVENTWSPLTLEAVSGLIVRGGTVLGTTNRDDPFHFGVVDSEGNKQFKDMSDQVVDNLADLGIDVLVVIGGDGSLNIAYELAQKGVKVVGVPKTIDNDLSATDTTFGFQTAVDTATEAIDRLHSTAESHHRIMVLEVMGRYAGWIALYAGIAGGADVILIPEIPYRIEQVVAKVDERNHQGKKFSIVVAAEGAHPSGGEMVVQRVVKDSHDPLRLGGIGEKVAKELEALTGMETRVTVLGHLQRGGGPIPYDRVLSTRYGVAAVRAAAAGNYGTMVSLNGTEVVTVSLVDAIGELKKVEPQGELVSVARGVGITLGE
jgi:6-phosphofructokinase 1